MDREPASRIRPLVVGPDPFGPSMIAALQEQTGIPVELVHQANSLPEGRAFLEREGYHASTAFVDASQVEVEAVRKWRADFPWLSLVVCAREGDEAGETRMKELLGNDSWIRALHVGPSWSAKELASVLPGVMEEAVEAVKTLPPPPLPPDRTRYLTDVAGVLFSGCATATPWELQCEAIVVPVNTDAKPSKFASALQNATEATLQWPMDTRITAGHVLDLGLLRDSTSPPNPRLLLVTARDASNEHTIESAVASAIAAITWAANHECRTLVLPALGCGGGGLDADALLRGVLDGIDDDFERGGLRHVVITDLEEATIELLEQTARGAIAPPPATSQRLRNDDPSGDDLLDVAAQVHALADAISLKDMTPPLVVGVLGGWGAGKSFAMHLLEERVKWIRALPVPDPTQEPERFAAFPYVGHPYIVRFDAWTYAKSDLWASLMQRIVQDLDDALGLEALLQEAKADLRDGTELWTLMSRLSRSEREAFDGLLDEATLDRFLALRSQGGTGRLWELLGEIKEGEKKLLETAETSLKNEEERLDEEGERLERDRLEAARRLEHEPESAARRIRDQAEAEIAGVRQRRAARIAEARAAEQRAVAAAERELREELAAVEQSESDASARESRIAERVAELRQKAEQEHEEDARAAAWESVAALASNIFGKAFDDALAKAKAKSGDAVSVAKIREEIGLWAQLKAGFGVPSTAFLVFCLAALAAPWVSDALGELAAESTFAGLAAALGSVLTALTRTREWLSDRQQDYQARLDAATARLPEEVARALESDTELKEQRDALDQLRTDLRARRERARQDAADSKRRAAADAKDAQRIAEQTAQADIEDRRQRAEIAAAEQAARAKADASASLAEADAALREHQQRRAEELAAPRREVEFRRQRAGITARSPSLAEFVRQRSGDGFYDKRLGVIHQVQKDLAEVTEALLPVSLEEKQGEAAPQERFPRGEPRIVLLVDDLDRCPPDIVVEMLEAAQLLVKTRLFVVVLAMDVRYVTRALERAYEGILVRDGDPSGLDYIEKIVQIPYRVPGITSQAMGTFLRAQMKTTPQGDEPPDEGQADADTGEQPAGDAGEHTAGDESHVPYFSVPAPARGGAVPTSVITFEPAEVELLRVVGSAVHVTPRAATRLVNVFKLLKIIWHKAGATPTEDVQRSLLLLLGLSARFPEVMRKLLLELEAEFHDEASGKNAALGRPLAQYLEERLDGDGLRRAYWEDRNEVRALLRNSALIGKKQKLSELGGANVRLVHSFCFAGEVTNEGPDDGGDGGDHAQDHAPPPEAPPAGKKAARKRRARKT